MNFRQLHHFVVTAQTGNILKAAVTLNISQSGLSRSLSALEHQIGLPLFERSPKGVTLTEFGRHFLPGAQLMLNEHRRYVEQLAAFRELRAGSVTIGINHSFAYLVVPQALTQLLKRWPKAQVSIVTDNYSALVQQLLSGDLDFALSLYTDPSMDDQLEYEHLYDLRTVILVREGHPFLDGRSLDISILSEANWALIKGASALSAFSALFESNHLTPPNVSLRCASVALLASVVETTDLLTILPEEMLSWERMPMLRKLPIDGFFGFARVGLIRRQGVVDMPIATKLADVIRREFRTLQDAHKGPTNGN